MKKISKTLKREELVIIFSLRCGTEELAESAKNSSEVGAKIVTCCCVKGTEIEKLSKKIY